MRFGAADDHGGLGVIAHLGQRDRVVDHIAGEAPAPDRVVCLNADLVVNGKAGVAPLQHAARPTAFLLARAVATALAASQSVRDSRTAIASPNAKHAGDQLVRHDDILAALRLGIEDTQQRILIEYITENRRTGDRPGFRVILPVADSSRIDRLDVVYTADMALGLSRPVASETTGKGRVWEFDLHGTRGANDTSHAAADVNGISLGQPITRCALSGSPAARERILMRQLNMFLPSPYQSRRGQTAGIKKPATRDCA